MNRVENILVVRLSAIGDIVFSSPLISALRRRYPDARISWLVQPESKALLRNHPQLDRVIVWPRGEWLELWRRRQWGTLWGRVRQFRRELRGYHFDLVIDLQGLLKSGLLAWFSGAPDRIGLGSREVSQLLMTRVVERGDGGGRIGSEYYQMAQRLGLPVDDFRMYVALSEADRDFAKSVATKETLSPGYGAVAPFTTRPQKHWPESHWVNLIENLAAELTLPVVILGGPEERAAAERIAATAGGDTLSLVGKTSLTEAAAVIQQARILIGVDTGLTHMGIAFDRPTLALFGSTCPYLDTTKENARVIYHSLPCSPCRRRPTCSGAYTCMAEIFPQEVVRAARQLLGSAA